LRANAEQEAAPSPLVEAVAVKSPYLVSLPVDFVLVGGGSIVLFLLLPHVYDGPPTPRLFSLVLYLTWIGNWPHISATNYRLYSSARVFRNYPFTAILVPLLVLFGAVSALRSPATVAPYFVKVTLSWILYHYCGQSIGLSLLYARRAGYRVSRGERFFLTWFIYGTFLCRAMWSETSSQALKYFGVAYPRFGVPVAFSYVAAAWTYACAAGFVFLLVQNLRRERRLPPPLYLLPVVTQYVWFFVAGDHPAWVELVPFFHGVQYLVIAWAMHLNENGGRILWRSVRWYALNFAGGACLFYLTPRLVGYATGINRGVVMAVVFAAFQVHHSFVDGIIWKLRSRSVVTPLLADLPALLHSEKQVAA
jgi:hypothetical protein